MQMRKIYMVWVSHKLLTTSVQGLFTPQIYNFFLQKFIYTYLA